MDNLRYYKGKYPCIVLFRPEKHNKCIIALMDDSILITLIRLCWKNNQKSKI